MHRSESEPPVVALLTDFGTSDHFVASVRGSILSILPSAVLVDITHDTSPHDIRSAGFSLWACYRDFPSGTVFCCVVDPGVGSDRRRIVLRTEERLFVAPDNGLLSFVLDQSGGELYEVQERRYMRERITGTFDGRDVFGPVAAHLAGGVEAGQVGPAIEDPVRMVTGIAREENVEVREGSIIHIDRFGNLITNLRPDDVAAGAVLEIAGNEVSERRSYFAESSGGGVFSIVGSAGLIEIAADRQRASDLLCASVGDTVLIHLPQPGLGQ